MQRETRMVISRWLPFACGLWVIGVALKFLTFQMILNSQIAEGIRMGEVVTQETLLKTLVFPYFPNVLDSALLIIATTYLISRSMTNIPVKKNKREGQVEEEKIKAERSI